MHVPKFLCIDQVVCFFFFFQVHCSGLELGCTEGPENGCLGSTVYQGNGAGECEVEMGLLIVSRPTTGAQAGIWSHSDWFS